MNIRATTLCVLLTVLATTITHDVGTRAASTPQSAEPVADIFDEVQTSVVTLHIAKATGLVDSEGRVGVQEFLGSGVLLENGRILTAAHVVHEADSVAVEFFDTTMGKARVIGSVVQGDVALLELINAAPQDVKPAELGNSDEVRIGSQCLVIGSPRGQTHTLSVGYISAKRSWEGPKKGLAKPDLFQTDAAINPGNSGGPMFNMAGQVIGIVSHIKTTTGDSAGLGYAITSNTAKRLLLERNSIWSGITEVFITGELAGALQLPEGRSGFLLQHVAQDSPGSRLGLVGGSIPALIGGQSLLLGGDILMEAFGAELDSVGMGLAIMNALPDIGPQTPVVVVVYRDGEMVKLEAKAGELAPWLK